MSESTILIAFVVIPLILLLTIGVLFVAARVYQKRAEAGLDRMRQDWRHFDAGYADVVAVSRQYTEDAQEPFLSLARRLRESLEELDRIAAPLRQERVALKQRANDLAQNPWRAVMGAPYLWFILNRDVQALGRGLNRAWMALENAADIENELAEVGWRVAQAARAVRGQERQAQELLDGLRARKLGGQGLEKAGKSVTQARAELKRIPAYFFEGDAEEVINQASREDIILAYGASSTAGPQLEGVIKDAQEWDRQAQAAADAVDMLRKVLNEVEQTFDTLPKTIDVTEQRQQLDGMQQVAGSLHATIGRLEVDSAALVTQEATRMCQAAQEMSSQLKRSRRELASLETVLDELPAGFKDLSTRLAALGAAQQQPVQLNHSLEELAGLNRQANKLGSVGRKRTPEAIGQDLAAAAGLRARQKEMSARVSDLEAAHAALVEIMGRPPLSGLGEWLAQARKTANEAGAYAPENWGRTDGVAQITGELDALAAAARGLGIGAARQSIQPEQVLEDDLAARLELARQVTQKADEIQKRIENIRGRLDELRGAENAARDDLEAAARELGQLEYVVRSNALLSSMATQEMERLRREQATLEGELGDRKRNTVDQKARRASGLVSQIETAANSWLTQLNNDTREMIKDLSAMINDLEQIAPLEEAAVDKAHNLLSDAPAHQISGRASRGPVPLTELVPRLRAAAEYWESCAAARKALDDFQPLIDTYEEAQVHRAEARQAVSEASSWLRKKRAWPPTTVNLESERLELEKTEAEWNRLRESGARAIARTAALGNLANRYQTLIDRVNQAVERGTREVGEVDDIEAQIDEQASIWEDLYNQHRDNPVTAGDIEDLLTSVGREHENVKRRYISGGLDYQSAVGELKKLLKRMQYFKAQVTEDSSLDSHGNVTQRKESRRV